MTKQLAKPIFHTFAIVRILVAPIWRSRGKLLWKGKLWYRMMESIIQSVNVIQHEEEVDHSTDYYDKYYNYYISDNSYYSE